MSPATTSSSMHTIFVRHAPGGYGELVLWHNTRPVDFLRMEHRNLTSK
jgi:hypothetical protein